MTPADLPPRVRSILESCPVAGQGVNRWLFCAAVALRPYRTPAENRTLLTEATAGCGREVPQREIARAVENSDRHARQPGQGTTGIGSSRPRWPTPNLAQIETIVADGPRLSDLWELSPVRFEDNSSHAEDFIDEMFPRNPLLCVGKTQASFDTRPREDWRGFLENMALIVPSPMTARTGRTQDGKISAHTLDNTGVRHYLVVECDFSVYARDGETETSYAPMIRCLAEKGVDTLDMGAAILGRLAELAPMVLAVHSGGKSLHGWFRALGEGEERLRRFMRYAVSIGADRATWTRSQFVRLPGGRREDGKRQSVYFFNPRLLP